MSWELLSGRSPWLWLGSAVAMLVAIIFGIAADDSPGDFGSFESLSSAQGGNGPAPSESALQDAIDDIIGGALGGGTGGNPFTQSDAGSEIVVLDPSGSANVIVVQDLLDGNGFAQTTSALTAEGGRERMGVLLSEILEHAEVTDWNQLRIVGALGVGFEVDRASFEGAPDQYLFYGSGDGDPSATVTITNPTDGVSVIDVTDIIVFE